MVDRIVSFALSQRLLVVVAMAAVALWGIVSFQHLPIDAYPDLSPPHVEIVTQWPGHAAEEVERLITIPIEVEMNGIPRLEALRSISLYGLSSVTMNFDYDADPYFARAVVRLGGQRDNQFELLSGLQVGDTIVAEGGVFLQFAESSER